MNKLLIVLVVILAIFVVILAFPAGVPAVLICAAVSLIVVFAINQFPDEKNALIQIFLIGLMLRVVCATITYTLDIWQYVGEDQFLYTNVGEDLASYWQGLIAVNSEIQSRILSSSANSLSGWGIYYIVGSIYYLVGTNPFAVQLFISVLGAATAVVVYLCSKKVFQNSRVAYTTGMFVAVFPSLIIWSSHILKDGVIIFFLVLAMYAGIILKEKLSVKYLIILFVSLFAIYSLRTYICVLAITAIVGSFVLGNEAKISQFISRFAAISILGFVLASFGVIHQEQFQQVEQYSDLTALQNSRKSLANDAASGFNQEADISTWGGLMQALPIGFVYLMLAPFPWQLSSNRAAATLPEMFVWWACLAFLGTGLWYSVRNRLQQVIPILLFTIMLTLIYSVTQGNVGTAYRQRAQLQVFYFMFIAVGLVLWREKRENSLSLSKLILKRNRIIQEKREVAGRAI